MSDSKSGVRFIRVRGRVVPIKDKDPSAGTRSKNYKKYGDGGRQSSRIDDKYEKKARKGTMGYELAAVGGIGTALFTKGKTAMIAGGVGLAAAALGVLKYRKNAKKSAISKEREYVRTFGTDSNGKKPSKNKTGI